MIEWTKYACRQMLVNCCLKRDKLVWHLWHWKTPTPSKCGLIFKGKEDIAIWWPLLPVWWVGLSASVFFCFFYTGRVFDPNKHCGVQDPETKRPCTRSLTCKVTQIHTLTLSTCVSFLWRQFWPFFLLPVWPGKQLCLFMRAITLKRALTSLL